MNKETLVGFVDKSDLERIEVRISEYEGREYVDIRTFWRTAPDGNWFPSKKGVNVKRELIRYLIPLLEKAAQRDEG